MYAHREDLYPTFGRWARDLAVITAGLLPASFAVLAIVLSIGGPSESKERFIGLAGTVVLYGGGLLALLAFVLALASKARREPTDSLALPIALFPLLAVVAVLIKTIWVR